MRITGQGLLCLLKALLYTEVWNGRNGIKQTTGPPTGLRRAAPSGDGRFQEKGKDVTGNTESLRVGEGDEPLSAARVVGTGLPACTCVLSSPAACVEVPGRQEAGPRRQGLTPRAPHPTLTMVNLTIKNYQRAGFFIQRCKCCCHIAVTSLLSWSVTSVRSVHAIQRKQGAKQRHNPGPHGAPGPHGHTERGGWRVLLRCTETDGSREDVRCPPACDSPAVRARGHPDTVAPAAASQDWRFGV